ncbi:MAG: agmatinase family protein [Elusimicrobia bacterium]|nr:agmatinase family protein [Elusimicrobiota bacterium]
MSKNTAKGALPPSFDPGGVSASDGVFGLPFAQEQARLVYLPVPWEATTSYGGGTSNGPRAVYEASMQVDLYDASVEKPYEAGLFLRPESAQVKAWNRQAKAAARRVIAALEKGKPAPKCELALANALGEKLNAWVYKNTKEIFDAGKIPALLGGDHSTPFGAIRAAAEKHPGLGVLHFDAHHDLRKAFEGFEWSHASIMYNVLEKLPVKKLVQAGIRDFCEQEALYARKNPRCAVFYDHEVAAAKMAGKPFDAVARAITAQLPREVWISFDIDGLDPRFGPSTGTPVPGGLDFHEALRIIETVCRSGRRIVGFDLCEVAPAKDSEWDANVGARLLYKLTGWTLASQKLTRLMPVRKI